MLKLLQPGRILYLLLTADTALLRLWFSFCSFGWVIWLAVDDTFSIMHPHAAALVKNNTQILMLLFFVHGCAVLYGVKTKRFSIPLLFCEGLLGVFLWLGTGIAEWMTQEAPGPSVVAGLISMFLLARYPTHYSGGKDES